MDTDTPLFGSLDLYETSGNFQAAVIATSCGGSYPPPFGELRALMGAETAVCVVFKQTVTPQKLYKLQLKGRCCTNQKNCVHICEKSCVLMC